HRERHHGRHDRVTELQSDCPSGFARHQIMASIDILRPSLLGATVINDHVYFSLFVYCLLYLGPSHHVELDVRLPYRLGAEVGRGNSEHENVVFHNANNDISEMIFCRTRTAGQCPELCSDGWRSRPASALRQARAATRSPARRTLTVQLIVPQR